MASEITKKSKIIKDITDISSAINRTSSTSTVKSKMSQLVRKQQELGKIEKNISDFENKISQKNKEFNRAQNSLIQAQERESAQRNNREKQQQREMITNLRQINQEIQKKVILEKETDLNTEIKTESMYILKGDIKSYSKIMEDSNLAKDFPVQFELLVKKNALDCEYFSVSSGDSILIIDREFKKIIKVAKRIIEDTNDLKSNPSIRIAIDYGEITYKHNEGLISKIITGEPLRIAARLEPYVAPDKIWCTTNCFYNSEYQQKDLITKIHGLENQNGLFNIKKKDSTEPDLYIKLFSIH
ncbi:MAG: hypothetical protein PF518_09030 [Spirochaetaceae bacterium]|nr:hypothetical protein [Spirochaetaceae bacterium]